MRAASGSAEISSTRFRSMRRMSPSMGRAVISVLIPVKNGGDDLAAAWTASRRSASTTPSRWSSWTPGSSDGSVELARARGRASCRRSRLEEFDHGATRNLGGSGREAAKRSSSPRRTPAPSTTTGSRSWSPRSPTSGWPASTGASSRTTRHAAGGVLPGLPLRPGLAHAASARRRRRAVDGDDAVLERQRGDPRRELFDALSRSPRT